MCNVHADHEEVAGADAGSLAGAVGAMKGTELADEIVVADLEVTLLAIELYVLRFAAENRVLEDPVSRAQPGKPLDDGVSGNLAVWADFDVIFDYGGRVNLHYLRQDYSIFSMSQAAILLWIIQVLFYDASLFWCVWVDRR